MARTRSEEEQHLLELAQRVLPAGSFGNLAGDSVIRSQSRPIKRKITSADLRHATVRA